MRYTRTLLIGLLILLGLCTAPAVLAHEDGLVVIMTTEEKQYKAGETAKVDVHVFHNGERVDADSAPTIEFTVWDQDYEESTREIDTERTSEGLYRGEIQIFDSDTLGSSSGDAELMVQGSTDLGREYAVSHGRDGPDDTTFDYITRSDVNDALVFIETEKTGETEDEPLTVEYELRDPSSWPWGPGDSIDIVIYVRKGGRLVEPDELELTKQNYFGEWEDEKTIPYNNPSTGIYEAEVQVPSSAEENGEIEIECRAYYGWDDDEEEYEDADHFYLDIEIEALTGAIYLPDYLYKGNYSFYKRI